MHKKETSQTSFGSTVTIELSLGGAGIPLEITVTEISSSSLRPSLNCSGYPHCPRSRWVGKAITVTGRGSFITEPLFLDHDTNVKLHSGGEGRLLRDQASKQNRQLWMGTRWCVAGWSSQHQLIQKCQAGPGMDPEPSANPGKGKEQMEERQGPGNSQS